MSWTNTQKQTAMIACRAAGIDDAQRLLILRQFPRAMEGGRYTSTSSHLQQQDFERFMAIIESQAGGELDGWPVGYWSRKAGDQTHRLRRKVLADAQQFECRGLLQPGGIGLSGWINRNFPGKTLDELDARELSAIIEGFKNYARRYDVKLVS